MENYEEFWESLKICKGMRADGRDGKCIDTNKHNFGCRCCPIGDGELYEPEPIQMED